MGNGCHPVAKKVKDAEPAKAPEKPAVQAKATTAKAAKPATK